MTKVPTLEEILRAFCNPSPDLINDFTRSAQLYHASRYDTIVAQDQICDRFIILRSGMTRIVHRTDDSEDTLLFGTSGDVFTAMQSYVYGKPSRLGVEAITRSEYWAISYHRFRSMTERYPELITWLSNYLMGQTATLEDFYLTLKFKSAEERLLRLIDRERSYFEPEKFDKLTKIVPSRILAQYLGITPSSLSRIRRNLIERAKRQNNAT